MPFDHCAECRRCCYIEQGYPALEISLTRQETQRYTSVCIETECPHLGPQGCTQGEHKPFSCKLYPLAYDPIQQQVLYDADCPLMPEYIRQLKHSDSEATLHLQACQQEIARLAIDQPEYLSHNFAIDSDYFELLPLPLAETSEDTQA